MTRRGPKLERPASANDALSLLLHRVRRFLPDEVRVIRVQHRHRRVLRVPALIPELVHKKLWVRALVRLAIVLQNFGSTRQHAAVGQRDREVGVARRLHRRELSTGGFVRVVFAGQRSLFHRRLGFG
eukprot:31411-Pelagococcus_subviridis.AAC.4